MAGARTRNQGSLEEPAPVREFRLFLERDDVLLYSEINAKHFVCIRKVKTYLEANGCKRLKQLLAALPPTEVRSLSPEQVLDNYTAILCILTKINKSDLIRRFIRFNELNDDHLPFISKPIQLPPHQGDDFWTRFEEEQWMFCAAAFRDKMSKEFVHDLILPVTAMEDSGSGGSAKVSKIEIHGCYNHLRGEQPTCVDSTAVRWGEPLNIFALKMYFDSERDCYKDEVKAYQELRAHEKSPLITKFYCDFERSKTGRANRSENEDKIPRYVVIEYADNGNLEKFFENKPPSKAEDIIKFWKSLCDIAKALHHVHVLPPSQGGEVEIGWHYDVKPENILVFSCKDANKESSPYDCRFKLTDFGVSLFKSVKIDVNQKDLLGRYGQGTIMYGAPECFAAGEYWLNTFDPTPQSVDIWSFGCILSEAVVWMIDGYEGLEQYRKEREEHKSREQFPELSQCFHDGSEVIDTVLKRHKNVKRSLRHRDNRHHITGQIVEIIQDHCLAGTKSERESARDLDRKLMDALWLAEQLKKKTDMALSSPEHSLERFNDLKFTQLKTHLNQADISLGRGNSVEAWNELNEAKKYWSEGFAKLMNELLKYRLNMCTTYTKSTWQMIENFDEKSVALSTKSQPPTKSQLKANAIFWRDEAVRIQTYLNKNAKCEAAEYLNSKLKTWKG